MAFRDVLALVLEPERDDAAIAAARQLAVLNAAARAFLLQLEPEAAPAVPYYVRDEVWAELSARAREGQIDDEERLRHRLAHLTPSVPLRAARAPLGAIRACVEREARCADICVMVRPSPDSGRPGAVRRAAFEGALMGGGRPVLLTPRDWRDGPLGQRIVVAWRDAKEAARAIADAAPLLDSAADIRIVSVSASSGKEAVTPGDVAEHLARRGVNVAVQLVDGPDAGEALLKTCDEVRADLLVMGGYGRARWRETILGGVTQTVLNAARLPLLMSH